MSSTRKQVKQVNPAFDKDIIERKLVQPKIDFVIIPVNIAPKEAFMTNIS